MMQDTEAAAVPVGSRMLRFVGMGDSRRTFIGVVVSFAVFSASFLLAGNAAAYVNGVALLVVFSGTFGAAILSAGWERLRQAALCANQACRGEAPVAAGVVRELLRLSVLLRRSGAVRASNVAPEWAHVLKGALELVEDRYEDDEVRSILEVEMQLYSQRITASAEVFRGMAAFAPSFGVAGSVIGLIGIMLSLGNMDMILRHIPVALVSTLYGVVLGNFFLAPLGARIRVWLGQDLLLKLVVVEGACGLARNEPTIKLWRRLNALLPPEQQIREKQVLHIARQTLASATPEAG